MSGPAIVILLGIGLPLLAFAVWQLLQEALVHVDSGSVGLLIVRGKATDRVLTPGPHLVLPFRHQMIQGYPIRELTYLTTDDGAVEPTDYADPPLRVRLGDRARVSVGYTIRFRIRPDGLRDVHERVGPDGIKRSIRDHSRRVLVDELSSDAYGIDDAFTAARERLEATLRSRLVETLHREGFEVVMFSLRDIDLGSVDDVIDATTRAKAGLELEQAAARVRTLRVENEAETTGQLAATLSDAVVRYRQIELGREALQRWDGRIVVSDAAAARTLAAPMASTDAAATVRNATPTAPTPPAEQGDTASVPAEEAP